LAIGELPELQTPSGRALYLALYVRSIGIRPLVRLWSQLSPVQRRQASTGDLRLTFREARPEQQVALALWLRTAFPYVLERDYPQVSFSLRTLPNHVLEMSWQAAGEPQSRQYHLDLLRSFSSGDPLPPLPVPPNPVGKEAPEIKVVGLDGRPAVLKPAPGRSLVLYFRDRWSVPCVGRGSGLEDLTTLAELLSRHASLAEQVAVIVPDTDSEELRAWVAESGLTLPFYRDPEAKTAALFGSGPRPRLAQIRADGKVGRVAEGYRRLRPVRWEEWFQLTGPGSAGDGKNACLADHRH